MSRASSVIQGEIPQLFETESGCVRDDSDSGNLCPEIIKCIMIRSIEKYRDCLLCFQRNHV